MTIESRSDWGAASSRGTTWLASTKGVKAHYTGGGVSTRTLTDHSVCHAAMRGYQSGHMNGNGWNDLGYSMWVCNHTAGIGRGPHVLPAANGPGLNSGHYAILFLVGTSGVTEPTPAMLRHFHEARTYLMERGNAGPEIKCHKDGYATSCPGGPITQWVRSGAGLPSLPAPQPGADDMQYSSFGFNSPDQLVILPNVWTDIPFREEYADPDNDHINGLNPSILLGDPAMYSLEFGATLDGAMGSLVEVRTAEFQYSAGPPAADVLVEVGDPSTCLLTQEERVHHAAVGSVQEGRKLRVQVRHTVPDTTPVTLTRARARLIFQS